MICFCKNCGKEYKPKQNDRITFCSRDCAFAYKTAHAKPKPKKKVHKSKCIICGETIFSTRIKFYCSSDCSKESARRKSKIIDMKKHESKICKCKICNKEFHPQYATKQRSFCSDECKHQNKKNIQYYKHSIYRIRNKSASREKFTRQEIFDRDNWICKICGNVVEEKLRCPHPLAATVDHIIPLSNNGSHTKDNVQCAHFICNVNKSNMVCV